MSKLTRGLFITLLIALIITIDQVSKHLIRSHIDHLEQKILISDFFLFIRIENTGAFLSAGQDLQSSFKVIILSILPSFGMFIALVLMILRRKLTISLMLGMCFVLGGGISNVFDRFVYNSVTDFINFNFSIFKTGVFNFADVFILIGIVTLIVNVIFKGQMSENNEEKFLVN